MGTESRAEIDLSEETRFAQMKRIKELNDRLGGITPWFNSDSVGSQAIQVRKEQVLKSHNINTVPIGFGSVSEHASRSAAFPSNTHIRQPAANAGFGSFATMNGWLGINNQQTGVENSETGGNQQEQFELGASPMDMSDEPPHSHRMSSTPSKASGSSSNTSADVANDVIMLDDPMESSSPTPSPASSPAKSATPAAAQPSGGSGKKPRRGRPLKSTKPGFFDLKPRTSIPADIPHEELARQSVEAALSSRLNPFTLHPGEYQLLRDHICELHISAYLNVRNRILRLWVRNPLVSVTPEEAAGCAYNSKWLGLAEVAYEWLLRNGYINFGCVETAEELHDGIKNTKTKPRKKIIVIGAGMAGLGCARQLEGLFAHYRARFYAMGEDIPRVTILEGRARIGGRIYSHPLKNQATKGIPRHLRCVAEMGAHIITGFDHGNPLSMIIRGQLALHYYGLKDNSSLYDVDGKVVHWKRDKMVEKLFNDILERASQYRHKNVMPTTRTGDRALIEVGRDPSGEAGKPLSVEEAEKVKTQSEPKPLGLDPISGNAHDAHLASNSSTGKVQAVPSSHLKTHPAVAAAAMGWRVPAKIEVPELNLDRIAENNPYPTLGAALNEGVKHYQRLLSLSAQDLRLMNWHFANLEYANAASVEKLSLGGWDQDIGNEFEGEHAQVIGGYQQVPRGIWQYPEQLELYTRKAVTRIVYDPKPDADTMTHVDSANGESWAAHHIVLTIPLGVLKEGTISFSPELPEWKTNAITNLGYGVLNKVVLAYQEPFWDVEQDMIGLLRRSACYMESLRQMDYSWNRGRFYLFWNCIKTTGRPVLIALMAGEAAHWAEHVSDKTIIDEVTEQLTNMFQDREVPKPSEAIVTRWGQDRFARGTYSYVGPKAHSSDYDLMAKPVGNLHFAGEATCGTHPATVHGAYISGLRAAAEIIDDILGPIQIPSPLVPETKSAKIDVAKDPAPEPLAKETTIGESPALKQARLEAFETEILKAIFLKLGPRPDKPSKGGANPFLLYSKDMWGVCKDICDKAKQAATRNPEARAERNEIRIALGRMWREASDEEKQPYRDMTASNKANNEESAATFQDRLAEWDTEAMSVRREYVEKHPGILSKDEEAEMWLALSGYGAVRRGKLFAPPTSLLI